MLNYFDAEKTMPSCKIKHAILQALKNKVCPSLIVAYSGGIDSSVLLHALCEFKKSVAPELMLKAIYIHHGLSNNADRWAEHCQTQCEQWSVPFVIEKVKLNNDKGNIEEQARNARYETLKKHQTKNAIICTGQHLDDQCETFLLALKRGSGPAGLAGMPEESKNIIRPLLSISRKQIEDYAFQHQLSWIEDESNQNDQFDRNFLRLHVLPALNQRWPQFSHMVRRSASLCLEQESLITELLSDTLNRSLTPSGQLNIESIKAFSTYKRNAILRMWLKSHNLMMPSRQQLDLIWQDVALAKQDANPQFRLSNKQIRRYQNRLFILPHYSHIESIVMHWDMQMPIKLPDNLGLLNVDFEHKLTCRLPNNNEKVTIRFAAVGIFKIIGREKTRAIKKIWQEHNIPPWQRTRTPLIFYNEQLITAVGVFITEQGAGEQVGFTVC